jgi:hypothetical protein
MSSSSSSSSRNWSNESSSDSYSNSNSSGSSSAQGRGSSRHSHSAGLVLRPREASSLLRAAADLQLQPSRAAQVWVEAMVARAVSSGSCNAQVGGGEFVSCFVAEATRAHVGEGEW